MDNLSEYMNADIQLPIMRPVAAVLALVADTDFYRQAIDVGEGMCRALHVAKKRGQITNYEHYFASRELQRYLHEFKVRRLYMWQTLQDAHYPYRMPDLIRLYSDWDNRPKPR